MSIFAARCCLLLCGLLVGVGLLVFCLDQPLPPPPQPPVVAQTQPRLPAVPLPAGADPASVALRQAILNGERIYHRLCYHCHGRGGTGDNNEYMASIGHKPADHTDLVHMQTLTDQEFFLALRDGLKDKQGWLTMPPWASVLTPAEMWDVIAYVRRLPLTVVPSAPASPP